ncbi:hypothetical protein EsH8_XIII_000019 [Colletotrichum jinshuiense]
MKPSSSCNTSAAATLDTLPTGQRRRRAALAPIDASMEGSREPKTTRRQAAKPAARKAGSRNTRRPDATTENSEASELKDDLGDALTSPTLRPARPQTRARSKQTTTADSGTSPPRTLATYATTLAQRD